MERSTQSTQRSTVDTAHGCTLERPAASIRSVPNSPSTLPGLGGLWSDREGVVGAGATPPRQRRLGSERMLCGRDICSGQKRGRLVGKTKRGKGTKIMGIADRHGLPLALRTESASPAEVKLVAQTLDQRIVDEAPERLIGDKAYDSDGLDGELREQYGTEMIAPHRAGRRRKATQDGRPLRRYRRRWKIERLFAWLFNFRRLVVRYEYHAENFQGFIHLAAAIILLRHL
jgi:transposase